MLKIKSVQYAKFKGILDKLALKLKFNNFLFASHLTLSSLWF